MVHSFKELASLALLSAIIMTFTYQKECLRRLNSFHLTTTPFTFVSLWLFGLLKRPPEDSLLVVLKKKRRRRGKRGGRRNRQTAIPVHVSEERLSDRRTAVCEPRTLVKIRCLQRYEIPPTLSPSQLQPILPCSSDELPPLLRPEQLSAQAKLPNFILCNARSLTNKVDEMEILLREVSVPIAAVTECWDITDEMGRIKGYTSYFNTRRDRGLSRKGGGVGIYIRNDISSKLLNIPTDSCHEVVWVECKPSKLSKKFSCLIIASVYYPESAKNRKELISYLQTYIDKLRRAHAYPGFIIAGDFNQTNRQWVSSVLDLKQVVTIATHQSGSTLDLIFTNMSDNYYSPRSLGPLQSSDHYVILWQAKNNQPKPKRTKVTIRPLNSQSICDFGRWIGTYCFDDLCSIVNLNSKVQQFNSLLLEMFHKFFPTKVVVVSESDKPWITSDLKQMIKMRCKLHSSGQIAAAAKLRNRIVAVNRFKRRNYVREKVVPLLQSSSRKWHSTVKQMTGKSVNSELKIPKPDGSQMSASDVNEFFAGICTTYPSITEAELVDLLVDCETDEIKQFTEFAVFKELKKLKPNCSSYPGELPVKLIREYALFLAKPLASIINQCFSEQTFPDAWKRAYVRVIPKVKGPKTCDQLRPISITPNFAKVAESFIYRELLTDISPSLDPFQYGCLKGCSTSVYLVRLYHLVVEWLEFGSSFVDLLLVDYRKAFDLIKHPLAAQNLKSMGARKHILQLVVDFLRHRYQKVYALFPGDIESEWVEITCGAPQGTKLAALLFLAVINYVLSDFDDRFKFVDDLSALLKYHVKDSQAVAQFDPNFFDQFKSQCTANSLQINENKSKVLRFNPLKRDFTYPATLFPSASCATILGVTFSVDCSFSIHVQELVKKGHYAMRTLVAMRRLGFPVYQLKTAYLTFIRPILEYACPVWGPQVHHIDYLSDDLEGIQKRAVKIILCDKYVDYSSALKSLEIPSLRDRRFQLMIRFGQFLLSSPVHRTILPPKMPVRANTRSKSKLMPVSCRTNRLSNSFVPFFTSAFNKM